MAGGSVVGGSILAIDGPALATDGSSAFTKQLKDKVPSRQEQIKSLSEGTAEHPFDVLCIGGGATGTGCALDAVTRYRLLPYL